MHHASPSAGYGPLGFMHKELTIRVVEILRPEDVFILSDVYYAGGTVDKSISSSMVYDAIKKLHENTALVPDKNDLHNYLKKQAVPGDIILLMGARDPFLGDFAKSLLVNI